MNPNELYHHGILGMHWGIRRYQPYPKGYSGSGKEVGKALTVQQRNSTPSKISRKERKAAEEAAKLRSQNLQKARDAASLKRERNKEKERALKEGTATELLPFVNEISTKEIEDAIRRIEATRKLSNLSKKELEEGWNKVDNAMKKVGNVKNWLKTGVESYQVVTEIVDLFEKAGKKETGDKLKEKKEKR